jgi:hypothetical protein
MDAHTPSDTGANSTAIATRGKTGPWLLVASTGISAASVVALARYAIDLLVPFGVAVLLAHSTRDALADWYGGNIHDDEPDPIWAVGAVAVSLLGTAFALLWIFSTSQWTADSPIQRWMPAPIVRAASRAEEYGWGRRAVLPGGPIYRAPASASSSPGATAGPAARRSTDGRESSVVSSAGRTPGETSATTGRGPTTSDSMSQEAEPISTVTILASSASVTRVGSEVHLTATVSASRAHPTGTVVFRQGSSLLGSARLDRNGRAALTIKNLPPGAHTITADFTGGGMFQGSRSQTVDVLVNDG